MSDENISEVSGVSTDNGSDYGSDSESGVNESYNDNSDYNSTESESEGEGSSNEYGNDDGEDEALALLYKKIEERNKNKPKEEFNKREPAGSVQLVSSKTQDTIFKPLQDAIRSVDDGSDGKALFVFLANAFGSLINDINSNMPTLLSITGQDFISAITPQFAELKDKINNASTISKLPMFKDAGSYLGNKEFSDWLDKEDRTEEFYEAIESGNKRKIRDTIELFKIRKGNRGLVRVQPKSTTKYKAPSSSLQKALSLINDKSKDIDARDIFKLFN